MKKLAEISLAIIVWVMGWTGGYEFGKHGADRWWKRRQVSYPEWLSLGPKVGFVPAGSYLVSAPVGVDFKEYRVFAVINNKTDMRRIQISTPDGRAWETYERVGK